MDIEKSAKSGFWEFIALQYHEAQNLNNAGIERWVKLFLILLRALSIHYLIIHLAWDRSDGQRHRRDTIVDASIITECLIILILLEFTPDIFPLLTIANGLAAYLLICLYVGLLNILFFTEFRSIDKESTSVARSLILLAVNALQVTFTFAMFYREWLHLDPSSALFGSFLVMGTIGTPALSASSNLFLIPLQIGANITLLAFTLSVLAGNIKMVFLKRDVSDKISKSAPVKEEIRRTSKKLRAATRRRGAGRAFR